MSHALNQALSIIHRAAEKGVLPGALDNAIPEFQEAVALLESAAQLYSRGVVAGTSEAVEAALAEVESERRQIAVEVGAVFRTQSTLYGLATAVKAILKAHGIVPPSEEDWALTAAEHQAGAIGSTNTGGNVGGAVPWAPWTEYGEEPMKQFTQKSREATEAALERAFQSGQTHVFPYHLAPGEEIVRPAADKPRD